jgi:hypothetical protein
VDSRSWQISKAKDGYKLFVKKSRTVHFIFNLTLSIGYFILSLSLSFLKYWRFSLWFISYCWCVVPRKTAFCFQSRRNNSLNIRIVAFLLETLDSERSDFSTLQHCNRTIATLYSTTFQIFIWSKRTFFLVLNSSFNNSVLFSVEFRVVGKTNVEVTNEISLSISW